MTTNYWSWKMRMMAHRDLLMRATDCIQFNVDPDVVEAGLETASAALAELRTMWASRPEPPAGQRDSTHPYVIEPDGVPFSDAPRSAETAPAEAHEAIDPHNP